MSLANLGESLEGMTSFPMAKVQEAERLVSRLNAARWQSYVTFHQETIPVARLEEYVRGLKLDGQVRDTLLEMSFLTNKKSVLKRFHFTAPDLKACYAVVAGHNDGNTVSLLCCVYELDAQLNTRDSTLPLSVLFESPDLISLLLLPFLAPLIAIGSILGGGGLGGIPGVAGISSIFAGGGRSELREEDLTLLQEVYIPHQIMKELQSRNVIRKITYTS